LLPVLLAFVAVFALAKTHGSVRAHIALFSALTASIIVLMLPIARPLWDAFAGIVAYVQFPWRLLILTSFALAFLAGAALHAGTSESRDLAPALALMLLFVTANYAYTEPQHTDAVFNYQTQMEFEVKDRELLGDTIWMTGARPHNSPLVAQYVAGETLQKAIALDAGATITPLQHGGQSDTVRVDASAPTRVMFYTRYFPGWTAAIDNQPAALEPYGEQGLVLVRVPTGSHVVQIRFEDTPPRQIGALVSVLSLVIALVLLVRSSQESDQP
jgi:hypothetical protein